MTDRSPLQRLLGNIDLASIGDPLDDLATFYGCKSVAELRGAFREQVEVEVSAMLRLIGDADAFDVIELMRMREFSPVPDPRISMPGGSGIAVEIVACLLLARGQRKTGDVPREETRPHEAISELHDRAQRLARLALYLRMSESHLSPDPMAQIAAEYQASVLLIRNLQYDTIRDRHEAALFNHAVTVSLMETHLGYSYADMLQIRHAITEIGATRMTKHRDDSAEILLRHHGTPPAEVPKAELQAFMDIMIPMMFLPADRASISAGDVSDVSGLAVDQVRRVLDSYSQFFDASEVPSTRVYTMLTGANPFLTTPLISDGTGTYAATTNDVGLDSLRRIFEAALPTNSADVRRYDQKARQVVSERLALQHLETILGTAPSYAGLEYFAPADDSPATSLGAGCTDLNAVAKQVEGDGLFVIDDVAICVEVKAKSIAAAARRGDVRRFTADVRATIGGASDQALRLQSLIEANGGIWLGDRTWLSLDQVREVRSVVVLLDDVGPVGTALGDLERVGVIPEVRPPWITSLHDLATIAEVSDSASEFLLYLRRRTDSDVTKYYRAEDELDLYLLFLNGELYIDPDPDEIRNLHPTVPPVKPHERRRHEVGAVGTLVGDQCGDLNAWMGRHLIEAHNNPPGKPHFNAPDGINDLIAHLVSSGAKGALRTGADLLGLSGDTQLKLLRLMSDRAKAAGQTGQYRDAMLSFAGLWGHPTLFIAAAPAAVRETAQKRLETYMRAKKHQLKSDRSVGLLLDDLANIQATIYMNDPPGDDPALDALAVEMGLRPVGDAIRPSPPPSARRTTRRLRGKKAKRRR